MLGKEAIGRAAVTGEVRAMFERYEEALRRHDVATLNDLFLMSDDTVRYGVNEQNYGSDAIAAYRRSASAIHPGRRVLRTLITSYGDDVACVCAEFLDPATPGVGRQTQTWIRTEGGWRIAVAHVSVSHNVVVHAAAP